MEMRGSSSGAGLAQRMAACPHCKGHLTEHHRCPRSPGRRAAETTLAAVAGGLAVLLIMSLIDPHAVFSSDGPLLRVGALAGVGVGLDRWLRAWTSGSPQPFDTANFLLLR